MSGRLIASRGWIRRLRWEKEWAFWNPVIAGGLFQAETEGDLRRVPVSLSLRQGPESFGTPGRI